MADMADWFLDNMVMPDLDGYECRECEGEGCYDCTPEKFEEAAEKAKGGANG